MVESSFAADLLVNIDVPDMAAAEAFYTAAFGLRVGRRFDADFIELLGRDVPIYLLKKDSGSLIGPDGGDVRRYERHWTPVHPDFVVENLGQAIDRVIAAGARQEGEIREAPYGRLAMLADPFGHGFCLIEFNAEGYDAVAS
ncbi:MAG: VOC family protein [Sphingosinicella sp.]|nr:VOC family protein [Sphingosinicella sp.]